MSWQSHTVPDFWVTTTYPHLQVSAAPKHNLFCGAGSNTTELFFGSEDEHTLGGRLLRLLRTQCAPSLSAMSDSQFTNVVPHSLR